MQLWCESEEQDHFKEIFNSHYVPLAAFDFSVLSHAKCFAWNSQVLVKILQTFFLKKFNLKMLSQAQAQRQNTAILNQNQSFICLDLMDRFLPK